ncbi:hypothetical protein H5T53_02170, partial [Candidatus Bipolaricaulota bacterium]|nr:hypothetical protein [Candidatus Bipolaricaulota bacterium]
MNELVVRIEDDGRPTLVGAGRPWAVGLGVRLPAAGDMTPGPWETADGHDRWGRYRLWRRTYGVGDEPLLTLSVRGYPGAVLVQAELRQDLAGLSTADSFDEPTFLAPTFSFPDDLRFLLATFGLGGAGDRYPGGYW